MRLTLDHLDCPSDHRYYGLCIYREHGDPRIGVKGNTFFYKSDVCKVWADSKWKIIRRRVVE